MWKRVGDGRLKEKRKRDAGLVNEGTVREDERRIWEKLLKDTKEISKLN